MKSKGFLVLLLLSAVTAVGCRTTPDTEKYLGKVLANLEQIRSAVYYEETEVWQPGDSLSTGVQRRFVKEYDNPADTTIGAAYVSLNAGDTTTLESGYDGEIRATVYEEDRYTSVDDFSTRRLPFRPMTAPFFGNAKTIVRYALTTADSIRTELEDRGDHYFFRLTILEDRQVEFFGKAVYLDYGWDPTSIYELWIDKSNDLPYKSRREMAHNISAERCIDPVFNTLDVADFDLYSYFNPDFAVVPYGSKAPVKRTDPTGQKAPGWTLNDLNERPVSLADLKSKVVLVQFTGIGCGPCYASIPFLKGLRERFGADDLQIVGIETWTRKPHSLRVYSEKNGLNYPLLSATDEVIEAWQTGGSAPVFFVLDNDRVIRKMIRGYALNGNTDKEITKTIEAWI
jgi:peroxiredoxin